ncbi:MAG: ABC transporter ATP-binding protein [Ruminococcus sp.]|nr:ABC transporter ATP-binding protein [Ruminococcus sp.]MCM1382404.1 ABC transporter ATP-binding protein [Muribaculaceae bacterium]MCM1479690.1 ABC transporter ATP-binding protein [Muribaculaceae bacterium]
MPNKPFLEIQDLSVSFHMYERSLKQTDLKVISDLHLTARSGEVVAVAGSSGSGKSLLASAVLGILPPNAEVSGSIRYNGEELTAQRQKQLRGGEIALVPQSVAYLDPLIKAGKQADGHKKPYPKEKRRAVWERLGLSDGIERLYPFQLSGGMARRVLVSAAMIGNAQLIIADEPTPGMSLEQALETLRMFREMADEGRAVIIITHDIDLAVGFADRVAVFYAGTTVEIAPAGDFENGLLRHPYSKALWNALPQNGFTAIDGFQPYAGDLPNGCLFAPRCPYKTAECEGKVPPFTEIRGGEVRCFYAA